jgi:hypothetical protein
MFKELIFSRQYFVSVSCMTTRMTAQAQKYIKSFKVGEPEDVADWWPLQVESAAMWRCNL